ncbi:hypothetical protein VCRA2119O432_470003 [Vibrio crassostreae]|nr:hypothetical protein VCRA2114O422_340044 [Vibrio crassostreae]CAK2036900.1 hypothetical protein VCRA2119O431_330044 [Vibrio crassostreae]CAK2080932.1 hypothetical protein VCRA2119O432_470003 [Vibrio crassostreae]CAK2081291.1 hypothetical protein VCRA2118O429_440003 [Vibrio crassostreae]CAK2091798.1 hypothetical protein VCRA2113O412_460003 [Vibrio crassostreae]
MEIPSNLDMPADSAFPYIFTVDVLTPETQQ